jgi:TRAP-type C4-dicarboxylate transport system substrate-binding protein
MKKNKLFTLVASISLILVLAALPFMTACAAPAPTETIVLKAISFLGKTSAGADGFREYIRRVNEAAKGELIIDWLGSKEVIATKDQDEAVRTGVIDLGLLASTYYGRQVPELATYFVMPFNDQEEIEYGFYDYINEKHKPANLRFIGQVGLSSGYWMFTNKKVASLEDFKGQRIISVFPYFMEALGAVNLSVPMGDRYTSMEQGLADGVFWGTEIVSNSWCEVVKYQINPQIYNPTALVAMNLEKFNSLPPHLSKLLIDTRVDMIPWMMEEQTKRVQSDTQKNVDAGLEVIELSAEDAKRYIELAIETKWADLAKTLPAETITEVKAIFAKK